jgi:hypothetical protein
MNRSSTKASEQNIYIFLSERPEGGSAGVVALRDQLSKARVMNDLVVIEPNPEIIADHTFRGKFKCKDVDAAAALAEGLMTKQVDILKFGKDFEAMCLFDEMNRVTQSGLSDAELNGLAQRGYVALHLHFWVKAEAGPTVEVQNVNS